MSWAETASISKNGFHKATTAEPSIEGDLVEGCQEVEDVTETFDRMRIEPKTPRNGRLCMFFSCTDELRNFAVVSQMQNYKSYSKLMIQRSNAGYMNRTIAKGALQWLSGR